jgi:hypothetical protein
VATRSSAKLRWTTGPEGVPGGFILRALAPCPEHGVPESICSRCKFLKKKPANAGCESAEHSEGDGHNH